jgi:hypothetical protein
MRTKKPRDLATAPEAPKHKHIDEPAKSLFKPCTKRLDQVFHGLVLYMGFQPTNASDANMFQAPPQLGMSGLANRSRTQRPVRSEDLRRTPGMPADVLVETGSAPFSHMQPIRLNVRSWQILLQKSVASWMLVSHSAEGDRL